MVSCSHRRRIIATGTVALALACLCEVTFLDSRHAPRRPGLQAAAAAPAPGVKLRFTTTAYCKGKTTASGVNVRTGIAAADPDLLPVGSVIQFDTFGDRYDGIYTVMDTGPKVQGRHVDIYMWSCREALELGRRPAAITVLRLGWDPRASTPKLVERLFREREAAQPSLPLRTAPAAKAAPKDVGV
jgi:3D (Asp-Asp-Asp) domain-containing protein